MIEHSMAFNEEDSLTVSNVKRDILNNLSDRYTGKYNYLLECTALDPTFLTLPPLEEDQRQDVFHRLKEKAVQLQHNEVFILLSLSECVQGFFNDLVYYGLYFF